MKRITHKKIIIRNTKSIIDQNDDNIDNCENCEMSCKDKKMSNINASYTRTSK